MAAKKTRTGATRMADVAPDLLQELEAGRAETKTLTETLVVDLAKLFAALRPDHPIDMDASAGITKRMAACGTALHTAHGLDCLGELAAHRSDIIRGWGPYVIAAEPDLSAAERFDLVRPFADDPHFGVREWAWLALRPALAADLTGSMAALEPWVADASVNIRRFAVEATRPRGVWSAHIKSLKEDPAQALALLEPVKADPARYVQDSAGNWLNDAAKSQPDWIRDLCARWLEASDVPTTRYIVKRALRSLR